MTYVWENIKGSGDWNPRKQSWQEYQRRTEEFARQMAQQVASFLPRPAPATENYIENVWGVSPGTFPPDKLDAAKEAMRRALFGSSYDQVDDDTIEIVVPVHTAIMRDMLGKGMNFAGKIKVKPVQSNPGEATRFLMTFEADPPPSQHSTSGAIGYPDVWAPDSLHGKVKSIAVTYENGNVYHRRPE